MQKIIVCAGILLLLTGCGSQPQGPERLIEDGIEVIVNRSEPYPDESGEIKSPRLIEEFVIDLEEKEVFDTGLNRMETFAVDGSGGIYILNSGEVEHYIFKFSNTGRFEVSFGRRGEGPGELNRPSYLLTTEDQILLAADPRNAKLVYFDQGGNLVREFKPQMNIPLAHPLGNGGYVVFGRLLPDADGNTLKYNLELCNDKFQPLQVLDAFHLENSRVTRRVRGTPFAAGLAVSKDFIYIGNEARGFEIRVFDQEGNPLRKIRRKWDPLPVTEDFKQSAMEKFPERVREFVYFPGEFPPFKTLFADENDRLFVVTYEESDNPGESRIDVFSPDGVFTARLSADIFINPNAARHVIAQNERLYFIREKKNGFQQFVSARIKWD